MNLKLRRRVPIIQQNITTSDMYVSVLEMSVSLTIILLNAAVENAKGNILPTTWRKLLAASIGHAIPVNK